MTDEHQQQAALSSFWSRAFLLASILIYLFSAGPGFLIAFYLHNSGHSFLGRSVGWFFNPAEWIAEKTGTVECMAWTQVWFIEFCDWLRS